MNGYMNLWMVQRRWMLCAVSIGSERAFRGRTVYPKKYAHGFVVLCFVVVMQSFIINSYEVFIHIHQGCFAGTGAIVRLPQCQWSKLDGYWKISQCITTTKHSKAQTVCIFFGIYCNFGYVGRRFYAVGYIELIISYGRSMWWRLIWHYVMTGDFNEMLYPNPFPLGLKSIALIRMRSN